jgi:hypothetical protein
MWRATIYGVLLGVLMLSGREAWERWQDHQTSEALRSAAYVRYAKLGDAAQVKVAVDRNQYSALYAATRRVGSARHRVNY